ncbi:MAG: transglutaminase domain-containing protein [bacterium]
MARSAAWIIAMMCIWVLPTAPRAGSDFSWLPVTEADWAVSADLEHGIKDAVVVFEKIVDDEEDMVQGKCYRTVYRRIRVLSSEGRSCGDVLTEPLSRGTQAEEIRGRTCLRDGRVFELDKKQVLEKDVWVSEGAKFRQKSFTLPQVAADCIVEYFIKYRSDTPFYRWFMQSDLHLLAGECRWVFCRGKGLAGQEYRSFGDSVAQDYFVVGADVKLDVRREPTEKAPTALVFTVSGVPAFESEPHCPSARALKRQLVHYYEKPESLATFWIQQTREMDDRIKAFMYYDFDVRAALARDLPFVSQSEQGARTICAWINKHIQNVDLDDLDPKEKPNGCVSHVVKNGRGRPLEIAATFCQMLQKIGVEAKMAFGLNSDMGVFLPEARFWQFDQVLVAVPLSRGGYTFYQPGYDYLVPGQVGQNYEGTQALVVGDSTGQFFDVPRSDAGVNRAARAVAIRFDQDLQVSGTVTETCKGRWAARHRASLHKAEAGDRDRYLKEHMSEAFPLFSVDSLSITGLDDPWSLVAIGCRVEADLAGRRTGDRLVLSLFDFIDREDNPFIASERRFDIAFPFASEVSETLKVELPHGWTVGALPGDTTFTNQVGECRVFFRASGDLLTIGRVFSITKAVWPVSAYADVRSLFQTRQTSGDAAVVVQIK